VLLAVWLLLQSGLSYADDTDIFLEQETNEVKPSIFFLLDDTGSMSARIGSDTKMAILKKAMNKWLDEIKDDTADVGLMNFIKSEWDIKRKGAGSIRNGWECRSEASIFTRPPYNNGYFCPYWGSPHPIFISSPPKVSMPVQELNNSGRSIAKNAINNMKYNGSGSLVNSIYHAAHYLTNAPDKHIAHECKSTHLVIISSGRPLESDGYLLPDYSAIENLTGIDCSNHQQDCSTTDCSNRTQCAMSLVDWMYEQDHSPLSGMQRIVTHLVTMGSSRQWGSVGAIGLHRQVNNEDEALRALQDITDFIFISQKTQNSAMVNASIPQNIFSSKMEHKEEIYYPLFKVNNRVRWNGNLKRYRLDVSGAVPVIKDRRGNLAYDSNNKFKRDAVSWWNLITDGGYVERGGAVYRLEMVGDRKLFTYKGSLSPGSSAVSLNWAHELKASNITNNDIGAANDAERIQLLSYIRSNKMGDPLHSAPTLFSYGCIGGEVSHGKCNGSDKLMAIMGTNEGFVHLFDTRNGMEQFAFMPGELLKNIKKLKENKVITQSTEHPYGMDNTVTVWVDDKNNNGSVDGNDKVYAYATMRRGGRGLYALDITKPTRARLLWKIIGGETQGFDRLGDTWSQPVKTKIMDKGVAIDVLIFAGGYHKNDDTSSNYGNPVPYGNDIYIINAKTGRLIWSASTSGLGLSDMKYSIPAKVQVLHIDKSLSVKYATQLVFSDTGGQIWRLLLHNGKDVNTAFSVSADNGSGLIAKVNGPAGLTNHRRFYHTPDAVVLHKYHQLVVSIGSGYHARPLNTEVKDRFYSIRIPLAGGGGVLDLSDNHIDRVLVDVTYKLTASEGKETVSQINEGKKGWYFKMHDAGEKVMSSAVTQGGWLLFNVYVPSVKIDLCQPLPGTNYSYIIDLINGRPVAEEIMGMDANNPRRMAINLVGLAGEPAPYNLGGKLYIQAAPKLFIPVKHKVNYTGKKTYWMDL